MESQVNALALPLEFVFVCLHAAKHQWSAIRWVLDIAQLANRLSAEQINEVDAICGRWRVRRAVSLSLALSRTLFQVSPNFPNSAKLSSRFLGSWLRERLVELGGARPDKSLQSRSPLPYEVSAFLGWLRMRENYRDKGKAVAYLLRRRLPFWP
jgi:hypothetical protein